MLRQGRVGWAASRPSALDRERSARNKARSERDRERSSGDRAVLSCGTLHYAHDRPAIVHCVVHCLGHCLWTLFTNTIHGHCLKRKKKKNKRILSCFVCHDKRLLCRDKVLLPFIVNSEFYVATDFSLS